MDSMVYHYQSGTNQLTYVNDYADDGDYEDDINNQATGNYRYDKIGNLSKDIAEQIDTIFWNVYGKISEIRRFDTASRSDLTFEYDAAGQRVLKVVKPSRFENSWKSTWYVRDAQGNILATYDKKNLVIGDSNLLMEITNYILDNYDSAVFMQFIADAFYGNGNFKGALIETIADSSGSALVGEMYTLSRKLAWDSGLVRKYFKHFCALQGSTAESNLNDAMWDDDNSMRVILLDAIRDCGDSLEWTEALFTHDNTDAFLNWLDGATLSVMWFAAGFPGPPPPPAQMITDLSGLSASQLTPLILDVNGGTGWDIVLSYLENSAAESLLKAMSDPSTGFYSFCDLLNQISNCGETSGDLMGFVLNTGDTTWCDEVINDSTYAVYLLSLLANGDEKQFYKNAADLNPNWIVAALHRMGNFGVSDYLSKAYKYLGKPKYEDLLEAFADSLEFRQSLVLNELHMYGSSRLGMHRPERVLVDRSMSMDTSGQLVPVTGDTTVTLYAVEYKYFKRTLSYKQYELSNHLGNVLTTVLDRKTAVVDTNSTGDTVMYYIADVYTAQTYYAFGSSMPGYSYMADSADGYRFGFNGQESENVGMGDYYSYEYRIHDARMGRFLCIDPLSIKYPYFSGYMFCANNPLVWIDKDGRDIYPSTFFIQTGYYSLVLKMISNDDLIVAKAFEIYNNANNHLNLITVDNENMNERPWNEHLGDAFANTDRPETLNSKGDVENTYITFNQYTSFYLPVGTKYYKFNDLALTVTIIHELYFHANFGVDQNHEVSVDQFSKALLAFQDFTSKELGIELADNVAAAMLLEGVIGQMKDVSKRDQLIEDINSRYDLDLTVETVSQIFWENAGELLEENPSNVELNRVYLNTKDNYDTIPPNSKDDTPTNVEKPQKMLPDLCGK